MESYWLPFNCGQTLLTAQPRQYSLRQLWVVFLFWIVMESLGLGSVRVEQVVSARPLDELGRARAFRIQCVDHQLGIIAAHHPIVFSMNRQDRCGNSLPGLGQVEILQFLIESGWTAVLVLWLVIPNDLELRVLGNDLTRRHHLADI